MNYIVKPIPYDYNTNIEIIEELIREYPFLSAGLIGRSSLDRGIFSLSIGKEENSVLYTAGFHGNEGTASLLLLLFAERICHCIKNGTLLCGVDIKRALTQLGITIIPCINPDGTEIFRKGSGSAKALRSFVSALCDGEHTRWKANAMGVDISRNFSVGRQEQKQKESEKGLLSPSPEGYCGEYAESEAETKALTRLCRMKTFRQCMTLTCESNGLFYKGEESLPAHSNMMAKILSDSCGIPLRDRRDCAGLRDWFITEFSRPCFSLALGNKSQSQDTLYKVYGKIEETLTLFALM